MSPLIACLCFWRDAPLARSISSGTSSCTHVKDQCRRSRFPKAGNRKSCPALHARFRWVLGPLVHATFSDLGADMAHRGGSCRSGRHRNCRNGFLFFLSFQKAASPHLRMIAPAVPHQPHARAPSLPCQLLCEAKAFCHWPNPRLTYRAFRKATRHSAV